MLGSAICNQSALRRIALAQFSFWRGAVAVCPVYGSGQHIPLDFGTPCTSVQAFELSMLTTTSCSAQELVGLSAARWEADRSLHDALGAAQPNRLCDVRARNHYGTAEIIDVGFIA